MRYRWTFPLKEEPKVDGGMRVACRRVEAGAAAEQVEKTAPLVTGVATTLLLGANKYRQQIGFAE